jgi:hypothetical protein
VTRQRMSGKPINCTSMPSPPGIDLTTPILANESDNVAFGLDDVLQAHRHPVSRLGTLEGGEGACSRRRNSPG